MLKGQVDGRQVEVRLRVTTRQDCYERHVFHVQHDAALGTLDAAGLRLSDALRKNLAINSPSYSQTEVRWLRVAFKHLGKLDTITVLEQLLDRTRAPITSATPPC